MKMFPLVLLRIIVDSLDYIYSRNDHGENRFYKEHRKKLFLYFSINI